MKYVPETFRAAVLCSPNVPLEIFDDVIVPRLRKYQYLVKIYYSGICHSQLMEARGLRGVDNYIPHMMGHEATGVVVQKGPGTTKFEIGDEVVLGWIKSAGGDAERADEHIDASVVHRFNTGFGRRLLNQLVADVVVFGDAPPDFKADAAEVTSVLDHERR